MKRREVSPWGFIGMGGMACTLFLVLGTAPFAPWWVTALLVLLWLVLLVVGTRWFVPHPTRVAWLPVVVLVVWFTTIYFGTSVLGWR